MKNQIITLIKDGTVLSNATSEVIDLGMFGFFYIHAHVKVASNASQTIKFQHSAFNEDGSFDDLTGSSIDIATTGNHTEYHDAFLRYVRFIASGSISTQPTLSVYLVAKER